MDEGSEYLIFKQMVFFRSMMVVGWLLTPKTSEHINKMSNIKPLNKYVKDQIYLVFVIVPMRKFQDK